MRLLRLSHVDEKTQNSLPIAEPFLAKYLEKRRVKRAIRQRRREDFCILLMGPPRHARKSKTPFAARLAKGYAPLFLSVVDTQGR